jgi:prepilin-type N-terminal cleavage/methylation domain-containing protein
MDLEIIPVNRGVPCRIYHNNIDIDKTMKTKLNKGFTLIELLVVITIIAILASLAVPTFGRIQERGNITKGISNCKQIITAMQIFASDQNGRYPDRYEGQDAATANEAFRNLFRAEVLDNEMIFGCPVSNWGDPDGKIGVEPFTDAVSEGENHWQLTKGLSNSAKGSIPAVYEAATGSTWPPEWDPTAAGDSTTRGRTWTGAKVIIGLNDSSVTLMDLESKTSASEVKGGQDSVFGRNPGKTILDIVEGGGGGGE